MSIDLKEIKSIKVETVRHKGTDLLIAFSHDLPGLLVPGRTHEELRSKLPAAITEVLEASGIKVSNVQAEDDDSASPGDFLPPGFMARAELVSA